MPLILPRLEPIKSRPLCISTSHFSAHNTKILKNLFKIYFYIYLKKYCRFSIAEFSWSLTRGNYLGFGHYLDFYHYLSFGHYFGFGHYLGFGHYMSTWPIFRFLKEGDLYRIAHNKYRLSEIH